MRSFYAPPPLIGEITDFNVSACAAEDTNTLQTKIDNTSKNGTLTLLEEDTTESTTLTIKKSITIDGGGKTLSSSAASAIKIQGENNTTIDVTIKNLTIKNTNTGSSWTYCLEVDPNSLKSLKLENVNLLIEGNNNTYLCPLLVQNTTVSTTNVPEITITGGKLQSSENCQKGYAIRNFNPVKWNITGATLQGWACLYIKPKELGKEDPGSKGSTFNIDKSELISANLNEGETNDFGCIVVADDGVTINITNTKIDARGTKNDHGVVTFNLQETKDASNSIVTFGAGNTVLMKDKAVLSFIGGKNDGHLYAGTNKPGKVIVTGGTFEKDPSEYVDKTKYIVITKDSSYTVKELVTNAVVSADNKSKVYGEADPTLTASLVNVSDDDKSLITYTLSRAAGDDAGTYAITVTVDATQGDTTANYYQNITYKNGTFTITKADSSLTKAPEAIANLAYTGSAQALVTAGTATGGTLQYVLGTDSTTAPTSGFKADIPTGTDAATYYVWYKVTGDKNHNDTTPACITVSISNVLSSLTDQSITVTKGTTKTLVIKDSAGTGSRTWALSDGAPSWVTLNQDSDEQATLTLAPGSDVEKGNYTCSVTVTNADSKTATAKISITVTEKSSIADQSITVTRGTTATLEIKDSAGAGSRTWELSDGAPSWVTLNQDSDEQATLTLAPGSDVETGSYSCSVTVTNEDDDTSTAKISITVIDLSEQLDEMSDEEKEAITDLDDLLTPEQKAALTDEQFEKIVEQLPNLAKVDLSGCENLTKVDMKGSESLTTINLEGCKSLAKVNLGGCSSLTSINGLSGNTSITIVDATGCSSLESLDVSGCTSLTSLDCSASSLKVLKVTSCDSLAYLDCSSNKLEKLEVSSPALEELNCSGNGLLNMDVKNSFKLKNLDCKGNSMAALDIDSSKFTALETIDCSGQTITDLSVTEESGYQVVDIWGYIAKFFARLFSASTSTTSSTVTISLNANTAADLSNIADVKAYDEDGREASFTYDESTGLVTLSEVPSSISYKYKTGYENVSMDVTIGESVTPSNEEEEEEHETLSGSSGGCNSGYSIFSLSAVLLMFAMRLRKIGRN